MFENKQWQILESKNHLEIYHSKEINKLINPYLFIGGVHGDEPEGIQLAENLIQFLRSNPAQKDWVIIPCLNPDGALKNQRVNSNGVDLNRNFPSHDWISSCEKDRYFPGPTPSSEEETKKVIQLIENIQPTVIFHFHSWKPEIILTGTDCSEAKLFAEISGYNLKNTIGYPTPGSLGQYGWYNLNIPVICIEEAEKEPPPSSWDRFKPAFKKILL